MPRPSTNLAGKTFSHVTVLTLHSMTEKGAHWLCRCDCGKEFIRRADAIMSQKSQTKSCGCIPANALGWYSKNNPPCSRKPFGEAECRRLWRNYEKSAQQRGLVFKLDLATFKTITERACHYCGTAPRKRQLNPGSHGPYVGNGIDRVDNSVGYVLDNCVPCCEICNKAKRCMTINDFAEWVCRISLRLHSWSSPSSFVATDSGVETATCSRPSGSPVAPTPVCG